MSPPSNPKAIDPEVCQPMPEGDADAFYGLLDELCTEVNPQVLPDIKICLADYDGEECVYEPRKLGEHGRVLLAGLYRHRGERRARLLRWLEGNSAVRLCGGLGSRATVDKNGFHLKNRSLRWSEVDKVETETINGLATHMYVLPAGRSGGAFDFGKTKYALARISPRKSDAYVAECLFWKSYSGYGMSRDIGQGRDVGLKGAP